MHTSGQCQGRSLGGPLAPGADILAEDTEAVHCKLILDCDTGLRGSAVGVGKGTWRAFWAEGATGAESLRQDRAQYGQNRGSQTEGGAEDRGCRAFCAGAKEARVRRREVVLRMND